MLHFLSLIFVFFSPSLHRSKNTKFQYFKTLTEWYYYNKLVLESFYFQLDFLHTVWRWGNQAALGPAASFTNMDGVCVILPLHHAPLNTAGWAFLSEFLWKTFMKLQSEKAGDGKTTHKIIFVVFFCGVKSRWKTARVETRTETCTKTHTKLIWSPISETEREIITLKTYPPFIGRCRRRLLKEEVLLFEKEQRIHLLLPPLNSCRHLSKGYGHNVTHYSWRIGPLCAGWWWRKGWSEYKTRVLWDRD